jgi:hypothetical protein
VSADANSFTTYSPTPLAKKLGIKERARVAFPRAPDGFADTTLGALPDGVEVFTRGRELDVVVAFFTRRADLAKRLPALHGSIAQNGGLWIAWPKRASGVETDITEDTVREVALPRGLVDNKVCAIDETWSGLRLVIRRELRR